MLLGVDVGGTKIATGLIDSNGQIVFRTKSPTDTSSVNNTLASIIRAVEYTIEASGCDRASIPGIGFGIPGLVDPEAGIGIASVHANWRNVPVKSALEENLHLPCYIENDVKAAALGENRYGAGKEARNLVFLSVGTGIAAGIIIEGKIYRGSNFNAGEIGHAIIEPNGPLCKCGMRGCLEAVATGPAIASHAKVALKADLSTMICQLADENHGEVNAEIVFQAASHGDQVALIILEEAGRYLGRAIFSLIMHYDPDVVILGGGIATAGDLIPNFIRSELEKQAIWSYPLKELLNPAKIKVSNLGQDVAILGAAALVLCAIH